MEIKNIFVAGAGLMGGGIAQVCAQAGYDVTMRDIGDDLLEKSIKAISWSVGKFVEKGKVAGTVEDIMGRLKVTTDLADAAKADFVFEAIIENLEAKRELFSELDNICPEHTILATNTSAIPVTEIAVATQRVPLVAGTHFFSPVPMMRAVEIVKGLGTSEKTVDTADKLCQSIGKETIRVNIDVAGIVLNRLNFPATIEAIRLVEAGVATVEDIDKGMRLGFGRPMGPFETADMAGLDIGYNAMTAVYNETRDEKFHPPMLLQRKVKLGQLGRKTGIGWYRYDENGKKLGPA
ncbi:3-hydroxybutyryl-CoA dehydrogenase [Alkalispirochaeta odontotermitis]|nr:3-hydroxybutyryl-CoA dehydrogenase [Alkalispirochaeta odontotermitis]CAB1068715.1 3-hydroxybutyryl-CoA dehydrogenase (EC; 3-hydroxyacyl-CoA dehydrogenase (EC [Olavius algarvensis Delta 1 endosymbiont]